MRKPDIRLIDELPDTDVPDFGYGQRELAVIEKLFHPDMPDGELLNLYLLVHDWHTGMGSDVFEEAFRRLETTVLHRMNEAPQRPDGNWWMPGFEPEQYREAVEAVCDARLPDGQLLELYAYAESLRGNVETGYRWQSVMDLCRAQILRRFKVKRTAEIYRACSEPVPQKILTAAEIEARHTANENYGRQIEKWRVVARLDERWLADALTIEIADIKAAEKGRPHCDPRMILAPLLLSAEHYRPEERLRHLKAVRYVALYYETIRRMSPKAREIWLSHVVDGLSPAQIATRQAISTSMARQRLREARREISRYGPEPQAPERETDWD